MLAFFISPGRRRVATQVLVPGSLGVVDSGLFFVTECAIEKRFLQIAVEFERLVQIRETTIEVLLFKPGHAQIVINLRWVFASVERLFKLANRVVKSSLC